jgi:TRAP-type C4-dicarboxylate transport system substrate-binding protein
MWNKIVTWNPAPAGMLSGFSLGLLVLAAPLVAEAAEKIVLKSITPWVSAHPASKPLIMFNEMVNKRLEGKLEIKYLGAGEVVSPFEQFAAVRNGVVDVSLAAGGYYDRVIPEASVTMLVKKSAAELRKVGYYKLMRQIHLEKGNVVFLAHIGGVPDTAFRLYSSKNLDKPDLSGLKIRVSPSFIGLVKALGGTPIRMKSSAIYTAMERGTIDGWVSGYLGISARGLDEVAKFVVNHPFYTFNNSIMFNRKSWDKLPQGIRASLERIGEELEGRVETFIAQQNANEDKALKKAGLNYITFDAEGAKKYLGTIYDTKWAELIKKSPKYAPKLKAMVQ